MSRLIRAILCLIWIHSSHIILSLLHVLLLLLCFFSVFADELLDTWMFSRAVLITFRTSLKCMTFFSYPCCICNIFISYLFVFIFSQFFLIFKQILFIPCLVHRHTICLIVTINHLLCKLLLKWICATINDEKKKVMGCCAEIGHYIGICLLAKLLIFLFFK